MIRSVTTNRARGMRWTVPGRRFLPRAQRLFSLASILGLLLALSGGGATYASTPLGTGHLDLSSASIASLLLPAPSGSGVTDASTPLGTGYLDFSYTDPLSMTVSSPTGEKPESKLWWNDGFWWGSLYNNSVHAYHIYRLNWGTQTWEDTGTVLDDRPNSKADTLWDDANKKLYVASHIFTTASVNDPNTDAVKGRVYRYTYTPATQSYALDGGFPVLVNDDKTETLVLDKDTNGRLWTTFVSRPVNSSDHQVYVNASNAPNDASWPTDAFSLGSLFPEAHVMTDDISSLVAFGNGITGTIGIMWSNQLSNTVSFATHDDSNSSFTTVSDWTVTTVPIPVILAADDHISLKSLQATDQGQVFAAVKTNATIPTDPQIGLVARDTDGTLSFHTYSTSADNDTRPVVLVDQTLNRVYVFVTGSPGGSRICYKFLAITSPLSAMGDFPTGNCGTDFIADATINQIDNATSFKRTADSTTGIVVLASDDLTGEFYVHNILGNPPPVIATRSPGFNATNVPVTSTVSVTFSKVMNPSTLTNGNFTLTGSSGAVAGTRSYDAATRTWTFTPNSLLRANTTYTATIDAGVQDNSGQALFGGADTWSFTTEPPTIQFSSTDYSVSEATATATITVTLNVSSTTSVSVNYATSDGTALAGSDYQTATNTLTFTAGQTSKTFTVTIVNDTSPELVETVNLALSVPTNGVLGTPVTATLSIVDNDVPTVQLSASSYSVNESSSTATITATLSTASVFTVTVGYDTSNITALAGSDYMTATGTMTFTAGVTTTAFTVPILNDVLDEADETVNLTLSNPNNATLGATGTATLTIVDNDFGIFLPLIVR